MDFCVLIDISHHFSRIFKNNFWCPRYCQSISYFPCLSPGTSCLCKEARVLLLENRFGNQDLGAARYRSVSVSQAEKQRYFLVPT